jgi:hypothetical protein
MTGTLVVKYRKPTPLHTELFFEAEIVRIEGRKIFTRGECIANDVMTAEAEGIFISIPPGRMEELLEKRLAEERERDAASD